MRRPVAPPVSPKDRLPYLVGYARVSTEDQSLNLQIDALKRAGVKPEDIHVEKLSAVSRKRPALDDAIVNLRPGDVLVVWRLDRLARNMKDLYDRLDQIRAAKASFKSLTENFDFSTATGQLILGFLALMAQFERQLTQERTRAGMKAQAERGVLMGRPPKVTKKQLDAIKGLLEKGRPSKAVAKRYKISVPSIYYWFYVEPKADGTAVVRWKNKPK